VYDGIHNAAADLVWAASEWANAEAIHLVDKVGNPKTGGEGITCSENTVDNETPVRNAWGQPMYEAMEIPRNFEVSPM
jgi:hypothetical protein